VIDNLPYIEELSVHNVNEKTTRLQTKYRVSTDKLKKEFPQQVEIVLNVNSKVYGT
jgi:GTP-dependent phosphoenolpyruvate carboxykinase